MDSFNMKARIHLVSGFFLCLSSYMGCTTTGGNVDAKLNPTDPALEVVTEAGVVGSDKLILEEAASANTSDLVNVPVLGVILPRDGSPRLKQFAELIQEGIQVALDQFGKNKNDRIVAELIVQDETSIIGETSELLTVLDSANVLGVIGPLQYQTLLEIANHPERSLVFVSPTASILTENSLGIYSLTSDDPGGARSLARYAIQSDLGTAILIYPEIPTSIFEAQSFVEMFESMGGSVIREFMYSPGATFFGEELQQVDSLRPDVLVLPLPVRDVELMAPQVTFYGLDSLEIRVLGTAGWTEEDMLSRVDARHMNGVVAVSLQSPDGESEGYRKFVEAYEGYYQHTLLSEVPALGYDAAALLLQATGMGASTSKKLIDNLSKISAFQGATGVISIEEGRVVREHFVICIQDGYIKTIPLGSKAEPIMMPPLPDPETDSIPEGAPDRIVGFRCPNYQDATSPGL